MNDHNDVAEQACFIALQEFKLDATSRIHGRPHWDAVWVNAKAIVAKMETGADLTMLAWFAYLHDCKRENDKADPRHGQRASDFAKAAWLRGELPMSVDDLDDLRYALAFHSSGFKLAPKRPLWVRVAWDADRLDLPRVGIIPERKRMATTVGASLILGRY